MEYNINSVFYVHIKQIKLVFVIKLYLLLYTKVNKDECENRMQKFVTENKNK